VWTLVLLVVSCISVRVLSGGRNCEIVICGRWLYCEYLALA